MKTLSSIAATLLLLVVLCQQTQSLSTKPALNRRDLFRRMGAALVAVSTTTIVTATTTTTTTTTLGSPALAAASLVPSADELARLQKGHARVCYLLDNWDDITKVCGKTTMSHVERRQVLRTNGGGGTDACIRTPLVVQDFLGYKSTADPLFKVDKLMLRAAPMVHVDAQENFLDVVEKYRENADQTAVLAYTSSWAGEENPNGSAENIENYLEQTRGFAVKTEQLLRQSLQYLDLPVLPPSAQP